METNWASENLQVIRTLMERTALYRRALAPVMIAAGVIGSVAGVLGRMLPVNGHGPFILYWGGVAGLTSAVCFFLMRRQALKDKEPVWSRPARRVAVAVGPAFCSGFLLAALQWVCPHGDFASPWLLMALWMLLYGCGLYSAGFFMPRGIRWFSGLFIICGIVLLTGRCWTQREWPLAEGHAIMGAVFGGLHLLYGIYLYFTEKKPSA